MRHLFKTDIVSKTSFNKVYFSPTTNRVNIVKINKPHEIKIDIHGGWVFAIDHEIVAEDLQSQHVTSLSYTDSQDGLSSVSYQLVIPHDADFTNVDVPDTCEYEENMEMVTKNFNGESYDIFTITYTNIQLIANRPIDRYSDKLIKNFVVFNP